jgi:hypothetical protein
MPQAPIRYGIQFDTPHGAREYPAREQVTLTVSQYSGDLYSISCLLPIDAPEFEPYTVQYTRDQHGFRNPTPWPEDVDMVFVGDSFTAAEAIQHPYWEGIGQQALVLGLPGSGSLEQGLLLEAYGLSRNPEIVVMAYFGGNDLTDTWRFFEAQEQGETLYSVVNKNRRPWEYLVTFQLALWIRDMLAQSQEIASCPYPVKDASGIPLAFFDEFLVNSSLSVDDLQNSQLYPVTRDAILKAARKTQENGAQFVLMYIPHKAEIHWRLLSDVQQEIIAEHAGVSVTMLSENMDAQRILLSQLAADNGFRFLDLTPTFQEAAARGIQTYFFSDTHWNQTGHDLARTVLRDFLSRRN